MKKGLGFGVLLGASVFSTPLSATSGNNSGLTLPVTQSISNNSCSIKEVLGLKSNSAENLSELLLNEININYKNCFTTEQLQVIKELTTNKEFLKELENIREKSEWNNENIIKVIIFAIMYFLSYLPTLIAVKNGMPVRAISFAGFAVSSAGSAYMNGLVPGSFVLAETFSLASIVVLLHMKNKSTGKTYEDPELQEFFNNIPFPLSRYNKQGLPIVWNHELEKITGYSKQDIINYYKEHGEIMTLLYEGEELEKVRLYLSSIKDGGGYVDKPFTLKTKSGEKVTLYWTSFSDGKGGRYSFARDVSGDFETKIQQRLFDNFPNPVSKYDEKGKPIIWNKKLAEITGFTHEEVLEYFEKYGEIMTLLYKGDNLKKVQDYLGNINTEGGYSNVAFTLNTKDGKDVTLLWTTIPDGKGGSLRTACELTSEKQIKDELEKTQQEIELWKNKARTDELTGVLNRKAFIDDMTYLLQVEKRKKGNILICYFDIDNFKLFNTHFGHEGGDMALVKLSNFIKGILRKGDQLYRDGGDEFILVVHYSDSDELSSIVNRFNNVRKELGKKDESYKIAGNKLIDGVGTSWGILPVNLVSIGDLSDFEDFQNELKRLKTQSDELMYTVKDLKLIKQLLLSRPINPLNESHIPEKNAIAIPEFNYSGEIISIKVISDKGEISLTLEEFEELKIIKMCLNLFSKIDDIKSILSIVKPDIQQLPEDILEIKCDIKYDENGKFESIDIIYGEYKLNISRNMLKTFSKQGN